MGIRITDAEDTFEILMFTFGYMLGAMSNTERRAELVRGLRAGDNVLHAGYIIMLRDQLSKVLIDAGVEHEPDLPGEDN